MRTTPVNSREKSVDTDPAGDPKPIASATFQDLVALWMLACFGAKISADRRERNHRFLEEALELVQSCGCTKAEALQVVDYVYDRPMGEPAQEVGGVMVTLAALCLAQGMDMHHAGDVELRRVWTMVEKIRAKQAAKPEFSVSPVAVDGWITEVRQYARMNNVFPADVHLVTVHHGRCSATRDDPLGQRGVTIVIEGREDGDAMRPRVEHTGVTVRSAGGL